MIVLTKELEHEIAQMTAEKISDQFTPEEMEELTAQMQRRTVELMEENRKYQESLDRNTQSFLKKYGARPLVWLELVEEDLAQIGLFVKGELNLFPDQTNICDGLELMDLVGDLLRIPDNRRRCGAKLSAYHGPINRNSLTPIDCKIYTRQVTDWLIRKVQPSPKIYWSLPWSQRLKRLFFKVVSDEA